MGNYVVRVVLDPKEARALGTLLEQFRYIGAIHIHRTDGDGMCFDIFEPCRTRHSAAVTRTWANRVAERMQSFGFNAVAAPSWPTEKDK